MQGRIHSFETFGSVDGPGVRFVIFFQGCRMRCRYCHNPDSWKMQAGSVFEAKDLVKKALRYRMYWGSEGGVTASGGEALLQLDFLTELFSLLKAEGVNTCLDTAAGPFEDNEAYLKKFDALMAVTDLVMLDLKHIDPNIHKDLTSVSNENILSCARHFSAIGKDMWIRHVLVPGINDDETSLSRLGDFIATLKHVKRVEVLPYHNFGVFKWESLNIPYTLKDTPSPSQEEIVRANRLLGFNTTP